MKLKTNIDYTMKEQKDFERAAKLRKYYLSGMGENNINNYLETIRRNWKL